MVDDLLIQALFLSISLFFIALAERSFRPLYAGLIILIGVEIPLFLLHQRLHFLGPFVYKGIETLWSLSFPLCFKFISFQDLGLQIPKQKYALISAAFIGTIMALAFYLVEISGFKTLLPQAPIAASTLLYQFVMPSLSEELLYRGLYLAIFNYFLKKRWALGAVHFSLGSFLVAGMFILAHSLSGIFSLVELSTMALVYGYLRETSKSIAPPIICHSCANGMYFLLCWIFF